MNNSTIVVAAALAVAASMPAKAAKHYIETPTEQIILQEVKCKTGGQEATLIEKRDNGGGGYGCWEFKDGYVYVHWTLSIGPNGTALRMDTVNRYLAPGTLADKASTQPSGPEMALFDKLEKLNDQCRGGSGDNPATMKACDQRDYVMSEIGKRGWCWGPASASGADKRWIRCR